jgi:hypothetical protein
MLLVAPLNALSYAGSRVTFHCFLTCFNRLSRPGISLLKSENVILLVDSMYAETIEAVKSWAALSTSSELIWILGEMYSEAKSLNRSQSVNFQPGPKDSWF